MRATETMGCGACGDRWMGTETPLLHTKPTGDAERSLVGELSPNVVMNGRSAAPRLAELR